MATKHAVHTGEVNEVSGIYKCARCSKEISLAKGKCAPPCPKHGAVYWKLVRAAR